jgi:hypothetical protein
MIYIRIDTPYAIEPNWLYLACSTSISVLCFLFRPADMIRPTIDQTAWPDPANSSNSGRQR